MSHASRVLCGFSTDLLGRGSNPFERRTPFMGWGSGGAMALGKLPVPGRPTIWMLVGQGPIALAVGAGGVGGHFYSQLSFSPLSPPLWETARYRLKYCFKGPLNPIQPTNQPFIDKRVSNTNSILLSPSHRPVMSEILLKRT